LRAANQFRCGARNTAIQHVQKGLRDNYTG
jgi:hypothetical protein